ncbi:hypothetical protein CspeluHIS016_0501390 [Cutaneotrichosporon spelunceum]|uniref:Uncharacterized protein n=1 Tax=Cutaneotrichosporon spelunceum TaxID=1672016 RepID=A0AAD3TX87_9TREE|nr:hypothetical protein CspeluHIS016_0501390 [Cutaneotrichosporon spelunceum]
MLAELEANAIQALASLPYHKTPMGHSRPVRDLHRDLYNTGIALHHSQPLSHTRSTTGTDMTETHHYLGRRHIIAAATKSALSIDHRLFIGSRMFYPSPEALIRQVPTLTPPSSPTEPQLEPTTTQPQSELTQIPRTATINSLPRPGQFYAHPVRGGPSRQRSAYQPSALPLGLTLPTTRRPPTPPIRLVPIKGIMKDTNMSPLSPLRRVSSSSPSIPKALCWYPRGDSENTPPEPGQSSRVVSSRFPYSPTVQGWPRSSSLRFVGGQAHDSLHSPDNPFMVSAAAAPGHPTAPPASFGVFASTSLGKRKAVTQDQQKPSVRHDRSGTTNPHKPFHNKLKRVSTAFMKPFSSTKVSKRRHTQEPQWEPELNPFLVRATKRHKGGEQGQKIGTGLFGPRAMESNEVDKLDGDDLYIDKAGTLVAANLKKPSEDSKHQLRLRKRREHESAGHKEIAKAKLANFKAGKIYAYSPDHPRYNPATNIDEWLMKFWSVWGTDDITQQIECELYSHFTDEEKRMVCTRRKKNGDPHRDLPKAVRMLYLAKYTDLVDIPRPQALECRRCVLGGIQCSQSRLSKVPKSGGTSSLPTCVACECSKGGCVSARQHHATRKPEDRLDFQVWLDRLADPASWSNFPPIDLAALPPPFPFNPVLWVYNQRSKPSKLKLQASPASKRAAEDGSDFEAQQSRHKRVSLEPQSQAESSAMGALRRAASKANLNGIKAAAKKNTLRTGLKALDKKGKDKTTA